MNKLLLLAVCFLVRTTFASEKDLEKSINLTLDKKAQIDLELSKTDDDVKQLENTIRQKRKVLLQRARALSYLKNFKWGGLMSFDDPTTFERNLRILSSLNKFDFSLFQDYKASLRNLAQGRADLSEYKKELDQVITQLQAEESQLLADDQNRKSRLTTEKKKSLLLFKGKMPSPTEGQVKLSFGSYRDEQNQYAFLIRGLLYEAKAGKKVYAVGPGQVIFRDVIPHWGETLIIQHDDNYFSVYAGIQVESLKLKDMVKTQDVLAMTMDSDFYFELRHFENPINPKNWFKEKL